MEFKEFIDSGWSPSVIEGLRVNGCAGLEMSDTDLDDLTLKKRALRKCSEYVEEFFLESNRLIFSGHEVVQRNSRAVSYRKLWKSMGVTIPAGPASALEWAVHSDDGVRFFGIGNERIFSDDDLFRMWKISRATWLVYFPKTPDVGELMRALVLGWEGHPVFCPKPLMNLACCYDALLLRDFGPDENQRSGMVIIGGQESISQLLGKR